MDGEKSFLDRVFIVFGYLMYGIALYMFAVLWGMSLWNFQETWFGPYMAGTGFICAVLGIVLAFNQHPGQDIRDLYRRRDSRFLAFVGCALQTHAGTVLDGTMDGRDLQAAAIIMIVITSMVWSRNRLDTWMGRLRETSPLYRDLGL